MIHPQNVSPHVGILLWHFEEDYNKDDDEAKEAFAWLKQVLEDFTEHNHNFYYDLDHPEIVAMIGGWESADQHFAQLHKSEDFREVLEVFGGLVDLRANFHVDIAYKTLEELRKGDIILLHRMWVTDADAPSFEKKHQDEWVKAAKSANGGRVEAGWRLDGGMLMETDALNCMESEAGTVKDLIKDDSDIDEQDLEAMNQLVTLAGFDTVEQQEKLCQNGQYPGFEQYKGLLKLSYTRRFVKLDLS